MHSSHQFGGDWTDEKLERVRKYLHAYAKILKKQNNLRYAYIDAFAGTGYRDIRPGSDQEAELFETLAGDESKRLKEGSAILALQCEIPFHKYIFIEKNRNNLQQLKNRVSDQFPEKMNSVDFCHADANEIIQDLCRKGWNRRRAMLFLDPYGMQVKWKTLEMIAKTQAIDMWLLFPWGVAVNRMLPRDGQLNKEWMQKLDEFFGDEQWRNAFYNYKVEETLFGTDEIAIKQAQLSSIKDYFNDRLKCIFPHVADNPLPLYNSRNNPLYILFFAAANPKGGETAIRIAQHILGT